MSARELRRSSFTPAVIYKDPARALDFLERAFGFELAMMVTDDDGAVQHSEMRYGDGLISVGAEWHPLTRSPASLDGRMTQTVSVRVDDDIDAHCARAKAAGAVIVADLADQFYGDRTYRAADPEGHMWVFSQNVRTVSIAEMEKASGLKITAGR